MPELLLLLTSPRSFSSVVSTIIGQHPEMYGLPELNLFTGDTVQEVLDFEARNGNRFGPPGLLRTLAELHDGEQTTASVLKAFTWLHERQGWLIAQLFNYLIDTINQRFQPKIIVEKTPLTVLRPEFTQRAYRLFPDAYYLHLTRHPITAGQSWEEYRQNKRKLALHLDDRQAVTTAEGYKALKQKMRTEVPDFKFPQNTINQWAKAHSWIIEFTQTLPLGQSIRMKGEDVLSEPDLYLPQIAQWLGLRADAAAIDAMKHPEQSPYACLGPPGALAGNDMEFIISPTLRHQEVPEPSLQEAIAQGKFDWTQQKKFVEKLVQLSQEMGYQ